MKQTVLVVDDQIHMVKLLERIVEEYTDYKITTTSNPLEARRFLEDKEYDLIITDLKMPGLDGLELLNFIKRENRFEEVIIMTAFASLESAMQALSLGAFDYLTKPFKKDQMLQTIDRVMKLQRVKRRSQKFEEILREAPYRKAEESFRREYLKTLLEVNSGDVEKVSAEAGLTAEEITEILSEGRHNSNET